MNKNQISFLQKNPIIVFTTTNKKWQPRSIFVEFSKINKDEIIITDNFMKISKKNLMENLNVFVLAYKPDYSCGLKIDGIAKYYDKWKILNDLKKLDQNKWMHPKWAIVVKIKKILEFK